MKKLLIAVAGLVMAQGAFAAAYNGEGYTVAFIHPGLTFDGTTLTKVYDFSGSFPNGIGALELDRFDVNVFADPGEKIVSWELSINGSVDTSFTGSSQYRYGVFDAYLVDSASGEAWYHNEFSSTTPISNGAFTVVTSFPGSLISSPNVTFRVGFSVGGYESRINYTIDSISIRFLSSVQAVPEPSTYGMMLIGLAGLALRRRKI